MDLEVSRDKSIATVAAGDTVHFLDTGQPVWHISRSVGRSAKSARVASFFSTHLYSMLRGNVLVVIIRTKYGV